MDGECECCLSVDVIAQALAGTTAPVAKINLPCARPCRGCDGSDDLCECECHVPAPVAVPAKCDDDSICEVRLETGRCAHTDTVREAAQRLVDIMCATKSLDTSYDVTEALARLSLVLAGRPDPIAMPAPDGRRCAHGNEDCGICEEVAS